MEEKKSSLSKGFHPKPSLPITSIFPFFISHLKTFASKTNGQWAAFALRGISLNTGFGPFGGATWNSKEKKRKQGLSLILSPSLSFFFGHRNTKLWTQHSSHPFGLCDILIVESNRIKLKIVSNGRLLKGDLRSIKWDHFGREMRTLNWPHHYKRNQNWMEKVCQVINLWWWKEITPSFLFFFLIT